MRTSVKFILMFVLLMLSFSISGNALNITECSLIAMAVISPVLINHKLYLSLMLNWVLNLFLKHTLLITSVCAEFLKILTFSKTPCVSGAW